MTNDDQDQIETNPEPDGQQVMPGVPVTLSYESAIAFAAEGLMDAYDIATDIKDTSTMIKISRTWLAMADILGREGEQPHKHEKANPVGFTHDLDEGLESVVD